MKKIEPQQIGDIIQDVFRRSGNADNAARHRALVNWINVVGSGINAQTTRRYVTDSGEMHVYISSATVKSDLSFMRNQLLAALNEYAGAPNVIKEIIFH